MPTTLFRSLGGVSRKFSWETGIRETRMPYKHNFWAIIVRKSNITIKHLSRTSGAEAWSFRADWERFPFDCNLFSVFPGRIKMEWFISVECFRKKGNTFLDISFFELLPVYCSIWHRVFPKTCRSDNVQKKQEKKLFRICVWNQAHRDFFPHSANSLIGKPTVLTNLLVLLATRTGFFTNVNAVQTSDHIIDLAKNSGGGRWTIGLR